MQTRNIANAIYKFIRSEQASGILLVLAAIVAVSLANSPWAADFNGILDKKMGLEIGGFGLVKTLHHWINDGLMAVFFLLIGLELKRELLTGQLAKAEQRILPAAATIGGLFFPAVFFALINWHSPETIRGWAIPAATDIAFALGVLSIFGKRISPSLRVFLTTVAVLDDLAAILFIAFFYTHDLETSYLGLALLPLLLLLLLNLNRTQALIPYIIVGVALWVCVLKSGIHATVAGVLTAFFIPLKAKESDFGKEGPLERLEELLYCWVGLAILPIFALANAGLPLSGLSFGSVTQALPLGIFIGLFFGKQIGIFVVSALCIKAGLAKQPEGASWVQLYGVSLLGGIGFTMSLFIGSLAFGSEELAVLTRLGVILGSLCSAAVGATIFYASTRNVAH